MEEKTTWLQRFTRFKFNRQTTVFLVCVLISTVIWFLIALSKTYTTFVEFGVNYTNIPEDKLLVDELPDHIAVKVTAQGFTLLSWKMGVSNDVLDIDVARKGFPVTSGENVKTIHVVTADLLEPLSRQLGSGSGITRGDILPDTIPVVLSDSASKTVPVLPKHQLTFATDFKLDGDIEVQPSVVDLFGPKRMLDTMRQIYTEVIELEELEDHTRVVAKLLFENPAGNIRVVPEQVFVSIPVDQFIEESIMVPVALENVPPNKEVRLFPDSVEVQYGVGLRRGRTVHSQFKAVVTLPDTADLEDYRKLRVDLEESPNYIKVLRQSPLRVEFIISDKE